MTQNAINTELQKLRGQLMCLRDGTADDWEKIRTWYGEALYYQAIATYELTEFEPAHSRHRVGRCCPHRLRPITWA